MKQIGAYEAKSHFSQILDDVAAGETVTVTRNGRPVARIVPIESRADRVTRLLGESRALRERVNARFTAEELKDMAREGRR
ncbi:MAG TPA: type II toxin-antitoxin system prevent-host-death family antitoxin [Candidatus Dormibacteraeota bacterium]|nr:type II toxin-antitoxin system prevent-host-death family antitoxin [Candidatus Dormibacteraeota bacterium]